MRRLVSNILNYVSKLHWKKRSNSFFSADRLDSAEKTSSKNLCLLNSDHDLAHRRQPQTNQIWFAVCLLACVLRLRWYNLMWPCNHQVIALGRWYMSGISESRTWREAVLPKNTGRIETDITSQWRLSQLGKSECFFGAFKHMKQF